MTCCLDLHSTVEHLTKHSMTIAILESLQRHRSFGSVGECDKCLQQREGLPRMGAGEEIKVPNLFVQQPPRASINFLKCIRAASEHVKAVCHRGLVCIMFVWICTGIVLDLHGTSWDPWRFSPVEAVRRIASTKPSVQQTQDTGLRKGRSLCLNCRVIVDIGDSFVCGILWL